MLLLACTLAASFAKSETPPNVVLIFIDDMGYADIRPFGARDFPTPNLDRLAEEGRRFTDFAVSASGLFGFPGGFADGNIAHSTGYHGSL